MRRTLIVAFVVVGTACGTSRSPNPAVPSVTAPTTAGSPTGSPLSDVSGTWAGQIAYEYPDDWCACCIPAYQASATFTQDGSRVKGVIHSVCFDEEFTGTLQGGQLSGTAKVSAWTVVFNGQAAGQTTTGQFYLATNHLAGDGGQEISGYRITFSR